MTKMTSLKGRFAKSLNRKKQTGASAIEYAILVGLVAAVIVAAIGSGTSGPLADSIGDAFEKVSDAIGKMDAPTPDA